jgi:hypothetical protein
VASVCHRMTPAIIRASRCALMRRLGGGGSWLAPPRGEPGRPHAGHEPGGCSARPGPRYLATLGTKPSRPTATTMSSGLKFGGESRARNCSPLPFGEGCSWTRLVEASPRCCRSGAAFPRPRGGPALGLRRCFYDCVQGSGYHPRP